MVVTATDSGGLSRSATLSLAVSATAAVVTPEMDAVLRDNGDFLTAYGASTILNTRDADIGAWNLLDRVYLRFPLNGLAPGAVSATLRLNAVANPAGTSVSFELREVVEDDFGELDTSWGYIPTETGPVLDTLTVGATGEFLLDLGDAVEDALARGDAALTLLLRRTGRSSGQAGAAFASREHPDASLRPALILDYTPDPDDPLPPLITAQPVPAFARGGGAASFSVAAIGAGPLAYQWFKDGVAIPGATEATLVIENVDTAAVGVYAVVVGNALGEAASMPAVLSIGGAGVRQYLINFGDTPYTSDGTRAWQSFRLRQAAGTNSLKLEHLNVPLADTAGDNSAGLRFSATSEVATVIGFQSAALNPESSFSECPFAWFTPTEGPQRETHAHQDNGKGWTYTVSGVNPASELTFQFVIRQSATGRPLTLVYNPGESDSVTLLNNVDAGISRYVSHTVSGRASYAFRISSNSANWTSTGNAMAVTVNEPNPPPQITAQPQPLNVGAGQSASFSVAATGAEPLAYQWRKDGTDIEGATEPTLTIPNAGPADAGNYSVIVSGPGTATSSLLAALTVAPAEPHGFAAWIDSHPALPPDQRGPDDNPARDGYPNLLKYALGLDPTLPDRGDALSIDLDDGLLILYYRLSDSATGITVTPQYADHLGADAWLPVPADNISIVGQADGFTTHAAAVPIGAGRVFLRLQVVQK